MYASCWRDVVDYNTYYMMSHMAVSFVLVLIFRSILFIVLLLSSLSLLFLLIEMSSPCGGSGFPLSPTEWSFTIGPYRRK